MQGRPCVCVCVCVCVKWNGGGCLFSVTVRRVEGGRGRGRDRAVSGLPPEQRLCSHCDLNQMETELHFLTECSKYTDIRTVYYDKIQQIHPTFTTLPDQEKLAYLLGEHKTCCVFAAQYWRFSTAWYGTVRYGTVHFWGVFHWVLYLVPDTFLVPLRSRFHRAVPLPKRDV